MGAGEKTSRASGVEAAAVAWAPLGYGEAASVGLIGDTGVGKSVAARALVREYAKRQQGPIFIVEDKGPATKWEGQARIDRDDLRMNPIDPQGSRIVLFRGEAIRGYKVDREEVCDLGWRVVGRRLPVLVGYDELKEAASFGQWKAGGRSRIPAQFGQGREVGYSTLWGTQEPAEVPAEAINQSSCVFCWRLDAAPLRLLRKRGQIDDELADVIRALPGMDVPPEERGDCVLLRRGRPWDRVIYRFDAE